MSAHSEFTGEQTMFAGPSSANYYPNDLDQGPFMKFSTYSIKGGVGSGMSDINFGGPFGHVCLPIPSGLNSTYGQGWDQEDVSAVISAGQKAIEGGKEGAEAAKGFWGTMGGAVSGSISAVKDSLTSAGVEDTITSAVLGATGKITKAASQRATGQAVFSNQYATYGGPAFRSFSFAFSLKALSESDTEAIRDITHFFKLNSAPQLRVGGLWRLYELPMVFKISFHTKTGLENFKLPRITKCALTDVGITYGGDRYSEFTNSAPAQVDLTLSFKEISLLSGQDINLGY